MDCIRLKVSTAPGSFAMISGSRWTSFHAVRVAEVLFVVAKWPVPRLDHWRTLLLARAIENQCFVIAYNRSGSDPKNPMVKILAEAGSEEGSPYARLELSKIAEVRQTIPVFEDRLPSFYQE